MMPRRIKRIAFLQEYRNRPETLKNVVGEVAGKGYQAAAFSVRMGKEAQFADLAAEAARFDLEVMAFTGYMKYQEAYLSEHRDQQMVLTSDAEARDQDRLAVNWGCPFHPVFLKRYLDFLETLGAVPNLTEVWVNDEAYLGFAADRLACYCPLCQDAWRKAFGGQIPRPPFASGKEKARFVRWRFDRWNAVHARMKDALNCDHSVRALFLTSPSCLFELNPWVSSVDLAGMMDAIDGVMTDPYYTFHTGSPFTPREVYLSECCRFVKGMAGEGKSAQICTQGFSHPTFTRPLDQRDGWWAGVIPAALGIDGITSYTYLLQRISPMQATYERSFHLDEVFSRVKPVDFAAVVDSLETQCFDLDEASGEQTWRRSRLLPVAEVMRHHALPYTYLPSSRMTSDALRRWPVVALPGVSCLSSSQRDALREYVDGGGVLIAFGETATRDETGEILTDDFFEELFGVTVAGACQRWGEFAPVGDHWAFADLPWPDEVTAGYYDGVNRPILALEHVAPLRAGSASEIVATFTDGPSGLPGAPAMTVKPFGKGRAACVAGIPSRRFVRPKYDFPVLNFAGQVIARLMRELAGEKVVLRAKHFPPEVPMRQVRPLDHRGMPTAEFLPCVGEDLYVATVASYFKEPMAFEIEATAPPGKKLREVRELIADEEIPPRPISPGNVSIDVRMSFDDCLKVFAFFFE